MGSLGPFWGSFFACLFLEWSSKVLLEASGVDLGSILRGLARILEGFRKKFGRVLGAFWDNSGWFWAVLGYSWLSGRLWTIFGGFWLAVACFGSLWLAFGLLWLALACFDLFGLALACFGLLWLALTCFALL